MGKNGKSLSKVDMAAEQMIHTNDINKLADIAVNNKGDYNSRKEALDKIDDPDILNRLAKNAKDEWIQLEAAIRCNNKNILADLLKNTKDESIQLEIAIELDDQIALAEIAKNSNEYFLQDIALNHIVNKDLLNDIILNCKSNKIKVEAALKFNNMQLLRQLGRDIENEWLRFKIASFIDDKEVLRYLVSNTNDAFIKMLAEQRLQNMDI
jgi:hypothetical protein